MTKKRIFLDLEQGSSEWKLYRQRKIGASSAPVIMKKQLKWSTPFKLWKEMMEPAGNGIAAQKSNWAIDRGNRLEPAVRAKFELVYDLSMPAVTMLHPEYDWMMASLDGWNEEKEAILEIKVPGMEVYQMAKDGHVHESYVYQLEHQLEVTGGQMVYFVCAKVDKRNGYEFVSEIAVVEYKSNPELRSELMSELHKFWQCVVEHKSPELTSKDAVVLRDAKGIEIFKSLKECLVELDDKQKQLDEVHERYKELIEQAKEFGTHPLVKYRGVMLRHREIKGRVELDKIPELKGVDLDKYRQPTKDFYEAYLGI